MNKVETKSEIFKQVFASFSNGIRSAKGGAPRLYLESLKLSYQTVNCGYNSGQLHHRKPEEFLDMLRKIGLLIKSPITPKPNSRANILFGRFGIVYPLKDIEGNIVNFYCDRFAANKPVKEFLNEEGIYPEFPSSITKRLVITENIIDAATIIQSGILDNRELVISLFDGEILQQHHEAITACQNLQEITLVKCNKEVTQFLIQKFPYLTISEVNLPEGKSLNELWIESNQQAMIELFKKRQYLTNISEETKVQIASQETGGLIHIHEQKILYKGECGDFYIVGGIGTDFSKLQITIKIHLKTGQIIPGKFDLYDSHSRNQLANQLQVYGINPATCEGDCMILLLLLDQFRDQKVFPEKSTKHARIVQEMPHQRQKEVISFLSSPDLMKKIDEKICESGVIGEEQTRLSVFAIASSYKHINPMHLIIQGSSGSGKTHLISAIAGCIPPEDVLNLTRLTNNSFYYLGEDDLSSKLLLLQDLDGLSQEALYALRELQSAKVISNFRPSKDKESGDIKTSNTEIKASFASLMATTKGTIYFDNLSRSIMLGVDESLEQSHSIVNYQNKKRSGVIDSETERNAKAFLQDTNRLLKKYEVINPYSHKINIPVQGLLLRRLNDQFSSFIEQITILHQYQRKQDEHNRLVTTLQDIRIAIELFFEPIFLKVDDLDSSLRQFFELLKVHVKQNIADKRFRQRDIRHALQYSRPHTSHFLHELKDREYIRIVGGSTHRGYLYEIEYWDDLAKLKSIIKEALLEQLGNME